MNVPPHLLSEAEELLEVDISGIAPGDRLEIEFKGGPIWIHRRTQEQMDIIAEHYIGLSDEEVERISRVSRSPNNAGHYLSSRVHLAYPPIIEASPYRSINKNYFVFYPIGELGCMLTDQLPPEVDTSLGAWLYDPCFSLIYDLAGNFVSGLVISDTRNASIPTHRYTD